MADEIFVVRIAQNGKVDKDPVRLSFKENQRLVWVSDADMDYNLEFKEDSPFGFNGKTFEVPARKSCDPGPLTTQRKKSYYYTAKRAVARKAEVDVAEEVWQPDPEVIVTE
jgi:hypothetical protein